MLDNRNYPFLLALGISLSAFTMVTPINWIVRDDLYSIKFSGEKINGTFTGLKADIRFDDEMLELSKIHATVNARSVKADFFLKTLRIKAKDGLDVAEYPVIEFISDSIVKKDSLFLANGKLKLKNISRDTEILFSCDGERGERIFKGKFRVSTAAYGITIPGTPKEIEIYLNIPVKGR